MQDIPQLTIFIFLPKIDYNFYNWLFRFLDS